MQKKRNKTVPNNIKAADKPKLSEQQLVDALTQNPQVLERPELKSIVVSITRKTHSGPIPPAEDISLYNESIPNGGDRIMTLAEKSLTISEKAQADDANHIKQQMDIQMRGQRFAFATVVMIVGLAGYIAHLGHAVTAGTIIGTALVSIVGAFIYGKRNSK